MNILKTAGHWLVASLFSLFALVLLSSGALRLAGFVFSRDCDYRKGPQQSPGGLSPVDAFLPSR